MLLFFPSCSFCDAPGPGRDRFKCVVVAVDVGGGAVDGTMSSPGTLPFLKMPLTVFEVAIAARDRLDGPENKKKHNISFSEQARFVKLVARQLADPETRVHTQLGAN